MEWIAVILALGFGILAGWRISARKTAVLAIRNAALEQEIRLEGGIAFALDGEACTVHIVDAPEGFTFDADRAWMLEAEDEVAIIDVTRIEE